jgi:hypothetical protein
MYLIIFKAYTVWHIWYKDDKCDALISTKDEADMHYDRLMKAANGKVQYKLVKVVK